MSSYNDISVCAFISRRTADKIINWPKILITDTGDHRNAEDRERDTAHYTLETLMFFGVHERMHVVDIWPFFGWYSKIIAPLVKDEDRYMAAIFPPDNKQEYMRG